MFEKDTLARDAIGSARRSGDPQPLTGRWLIDPGGSRVRFLVFKLGVIPVLGRFRDVRGALSWRRPEVIEAHASIRTAGVTTYLPPRDLHVRGRHYLDARRHPVIRARSSWVRQPDGDRIETVVSLEISGVSRHVRLSGRSEQANDGAMTVWLHGELDRRDFGIRPLMGSGGVLIGNRIRIRAKLRYVTAAE